MKKNYQNPQNSADLTFFFTLYIYIIYIYIYIYIYKLTSLTPDDQSSGRSSMFWFNTPRDIHSSVGLA